MICIKSLINKYKLNTNNDDEKTINNVDYIIKLSIQKKKEKWYLISHIINNNVKPD